MDGVVTESDFDCASLSCELKSILHQMKQNLAIQDPVCTNMFGYLVYYLEFNFELLFSSLNLVRFQKLVDKLEHCVGKRFHVYAKLI